LGTIRRKTMPGVKVITETKETDVTFLENVEVDFVSLVRHGANQAPFRVIKEDKGGGKMSMVVQSILLPKTATLTGLAAEKGLEWLTEAKETEKEEFDEYDKYVQVEAEKFDGGLQLTKIHSAGAFALVGKLKNVDEEKSALTLGSASEKEIDLAVSPMETAVATQTGPSYVITFRDMFEKELSSFLDVVRGAMSQSSADAKKRKTAVLGALESFKNFLAVGLDAISGGGKKKEDASTAEKIDEILGAIKDGGGKMFKTKEEFQTAVLEILDVKLKELKEAGGSTEQMTDEEKAAAEKVATEKAAAEKAAAEKTDTEKAAAQKEIVEKVAKLSTDMADLSEKFEDFGNQLETHPAGEEEDDTPAGEEEEKPSVFSGLLTKKSPKEE